MAEETLTWWRSRWARCCVDKQPAGGASTLVTFARILILLTVLPLIELALLLLMGRYTSIWFTLAFVILTGVAGAALLRYQGVQTFRNIQRDLREGQMPTDSLLDGLLLFIAAILLITPGVLTDFVGITLLIPACRKLYRGWLVRWFKARFKLRSFTAAPRTQVIDSHVVDASSPDRGERGGSAP